MWGLFASERGAQSYRALHTRMRGGRRRGKRKARPPRDARGGLRPACARRRRRGYSSYADKVSKAPENLVGRDLHAPEPDMLRLTNITRIKRLRLLRLRACWEFPAGWPSVAP